MQSPTPDKSTSKALHSTHEISKRRLGEPDATGNTIKKIFQKHLDDWIVYKSDAVHAEIADELHSENPPLMESYLNRAGQVQDLKAQITYLLTEVTNREKYEGSLADAMAMALRNDVTSARKRLEETLGQINNDYYIVARFRYLEYTFLCAVPLLVILGLSAWAADAFNYEGGNLLLAGTAGLIGAIFSIAIAIRSRAVGTDTNFRALLTDCFVRLIIGVISGCFLQLLLEAGAFPKISVGDAVISKDHITWRTVVTIGFIAGFLERLVPNLLQEGRVTPSLDQPRVRPKAGPKAGRPHPAGPSRQK